jgi:hypothetical protein
MGFRALRDSAPFGVSGTNKQERPRVISGAFFRNQPEDYSSGIADRSTGGYPMSCSDSIGMIFDGVSGRGG